MAQTQTEGSQTFALVLETSDLGLSWVVKNRTCNSNWTHLPWDLTTLRLSLRLEGKRLRRLDLRSANIEKSHAAVHLTHIGMLWCIELDIQRTVSIQKEVLLWFWPLRYCNWIIKHEQKDLQRLYLLTCKYQVSKTWDLTDFLSHQTSNTHLTFLKWQWQGLTFRSFFFAWHFVM